MSKHYSVEAAIASCRTTAFSMMCAIMSEPARQENELEHTVYIKRDGERIEVIVSWEMKQSSFGDWFEDVTTTTADGQPIYLDSLEHEEAVRQIKRR